MLQQSKDPAALLAKEDSNGMTALQLALSKTTITKEPHADLAAVLQSEYGAQALPVTPRTHHPTKHAMVTAADRLRYKAVVLSVVFRPQRTSHGHGVETYSESQMIASPVLSQRRRMSCLRCVSHPAP